ncbi:MAG: OmpA family protein, partial [Cytophagaceae bacterium]
SGTGFNINSTRVVNLSDKDNDGIPDNQDLCPNVPGSAENRGCPEIINQEEKEMLKQAINNLFFESGKDVILQTSFNSLNELVKILNSNPKSHVMIVGHTDNVGDYANNIVLSKKRAAAVKQYLVKNGISQNRINTNGVGSDQPLTTNDTEEGRMANRRVEIVFMSK